jgi:hypothetical protein
MRRLSTSSRLIAPVTLLANLPNAELIRTRLAAAETSGVADFTAPAAWILVNQRRILANQEKIMDKG